VKRGESPIKAHGRLIVIDGGFSSAYYPKTGIGGYTLIYNSEGMRLVSHRPFISKENILKSNGDVISETVIFEKRRDKIRVRLKQNTGTGEGEPLEVGDGLKLEGQKLSVDQSALSLNYSKQITGKPKINGVELDGDKTLEALGIPTGGGGEKPWQKIGTFTANDNINQWIIETDENGKPFACTEFRIRLQICLFKDTDVSSMNHGLRFYGDDGKMYEVSLGAVENGVIPIVSGAEVESVSATFKNPAVMDITTHCGLLVPEIATEGLNNLGYVILKGVCRNRGVQHSANHFTKIQYSLGWPQNLVMKDSTIEIWGR
jgi:hypothetical protein